MLKSHSITTRNYAKTYYQTLMEVGWPLRMEKPKIDKIFLKNEKIASFTKKLRKFVMLKCWKPFYYRYAVIYYKTLQQVSLSLKN